MICNNCFGATFETKFSLENILPIIKRPMDEKVGVYMFEVISEVISNTITVFAYIFCILFLFSHRGELGLVFGTRKI